MTVNECITQLTKMMDTGEISGDDIVAGWGDLPEEHILFEKIGIQTRSNEYYDKGDHPFRVNDNLKKLVTLHDACWRD